MRRRKMTKKEIIIRSNSSLSILLTVLFIALKLLGKITWSWFWVLSPTLIPIFIGIIAFVIGIILFILNNKARKVDKKETK